jgi:hypothetical protein
MALVTLLAFFIFGFFISGFGGGSSGTADLIPATTSHHSVKCWARMMTRSSAGENRRDCGGPPANP